MAAFPDFIASLDADPLRRGKQFEVFVKWFLQHDPGWATQVDQVWLWHEYPGRWGMDCGIDLVFRHKSGETWAVQAKCYAAHHDITKHDVDKFLSESNRAGIAKRLLIATTDRMGANARQVCDAQDKPVVRYLLAHFEGANVDYPASMAELPVAARKAKPQPREHQAEAIAAVAAAFGTADRGQLIMACGTGKTFTTLWIKERLASASTLVLLPSLGLLAQTLHEWTLAANEPFEVLCVCSDDTVAKRGGDEAVHSVADVAFPVTSATGDIREFLLRPGPKVVFSTYQSSPLIAKVQLDAAVPPFDLAIADEAHRCAGKAGSDFSAVLDARRIRAAKRLFATATPRTYSTSVKKAAGERGTDMVGMDDPAVFGHVAYALPFGEAIRRELLTDYRVVIIGVDNPTIAAWIDNRELLQTASGIETDAESLAAQIGLLKACKDYDLRRVISFHSRVSRAEQFAQDLVQVAGWVGDTHRPAGTLKTDFVSGAMPTDRRRVKLSQLKALANDERALLANARCLSEGVDVPSLDGVAFIDPRSSQIDIIQAVGRAIRLSASKTAGTIVLPVFIEDGADPVASIEASNFKPIWDVLNALKAHDDVLSAQLDQIRTGLGKRPGSAVGPEALSRIQFDLPAPVDASFGEALRTYLVERVTESWEFGFGALQAYAEEHGDCLVPRSHELKDGCRLGEWVKTQRSNQAGISSPRRVRLEALRGWTWNPFDQAWETGYQHLSDYEAANGDCLVPAKHELTNGYGLGQWVTVQRTSQRRMPPERKARLESLRGWTWNPHDEAWECGFRYLADYVAANGDCVIPQRYKLADGYRLGQWVATQRGNQSTISAERKARLAALTGWTWSLRDAAWEAGFRWLTEYSAANGDCLVPSEHMTVDGFRLGGWVTTQRSNRSTMSPERAARLEPLKGWAWSPIDEAWETGFRHLADYAANAGDCSVTALHKLADGFRLGGWVVTQRSNRATMSPEKTARLESLQGWSWSPRDEAWETGFSHLAAYAVNAGHCLVPALYEHLDGYPLGQWVRVQRGIRATISPEKFARLESLKEWTWSPLDEAWEIGFRQLAEYAAKAGDCSVPASHEGPDGYRLGRWVRFQRGRQATIAPDRKGRLEALPGWRWKARDGQ